MHFLFPNVLWGLLALSIPLIVHLFNFRRTKKIYFSNVSLLKAVETQSSSYRKLKKILIMAARMLFLACLVLAFAQPNFSSNSVNSRLSNLGMNGIYLDNSLSMQNTADNKRLIDLAIIKVEDLLSIFNRAPNIQLSTNDFDGQDNFVQNASKIKDKLTTIDFSESPRSLEQVYKRQHSIAQKNNSTAENQLFWFSDFQKSTAGNLAALKIDTKDHVHLIPIQAKNYQNVFIDSVWLNVPLVREMQTNELEVKVFNSGNKSVDKLSLKLYIDNVQTSTSSVSINSNGHAIAKFNFTVRDRGVHKAKIMFDDQPIAFDNNYYFILNASPSLRILHLYNQQSAQNYLGKMYSNDSLFNYSSHNINNIDLEQIQNADLVLLEGISNVEGNLKNKLTEFVKKGGSLVVCPSDNPNVPSLQNFLGAFGITNLIANLEATPTMLDLNEPNKASPFFNDVFDKGTISGVVSVPKAAWKIKWSGAVDKILSLKNGLNFLTRTKVANGSLYVLASPLNNTFGNFAEHAFFVPTFYKISSMSSKADRLAYSFQESHLDFFMPDAAPNATYKLKNGKLEMIPIQKIVDNRLFLELPKSSELTNEQFLTSGFFDLSINGKVVKTLAINHDEKESKLDSYSLDELKTELNNQKNITIYDGLADADFISAFKDKSSGTPLWKYFLIAALLFLLTEILLVRFMKS